MAFDSFSRRDFLAGCAAIPLAGMLPTIAKAEISLGSAKFKTVSDGNLTLPGDFIFGNMPQDTLEDILKRYEIPRDRFHPECNLALYEYGENTVLFDVGSGPDFMPSAGKLIENLEALDMSADDITHVVFTHAHPDHIWGLLDDFDEPLFPDATYMMGEAEWDYWWNPDTVNQIGEARAAFAVGAKRRMEAIEDSVVLFNDGEEILPGIAAVASHGHTPGHMAFEVKNGSQSAMVVGDAIGNHHVAFEKPDWASGSDQDPELAVENRLKLLDRIASEKMDMIGFHLPNGGMGRAEAKEGGYRFIGEAS